MRIHVLQHVEFEGPGYIRNWAKENHHDLTKSQIFKSATLPQGNSIDALVVMGGPMGCYDTADFPWLKKEKEFIKEFLELNRPTIGICLGAQLLADVMGGTVMEAEQEEIGWFPVSKTEEGTRSDLLNDWPEECTVLHWHGDTYELPDQATNLLRSEGCQNQFFRYEGNVIGIQFHLEMTPRGINRLIRNSNLEEKEGEFVQSEEEIRQEIDRTNRLNVKMGNLLEDVINNN